MKIELNINDKDSPGTLPAMKLDETGTVTISFKVIGANRYKDIDSNSEYISYSLEGELDSISVSKVKNLQDAVDRVKNSDIYVRTQTSPAP